ncbi:hypothetical protein [Bernardetia sp. MNP-M8]|uniref:hypothetical protein n=1 Tax=Bernardetia sp. MNP-M8 TaxID=3127470 RepID=UPI0030CDDD6B
MIDAQVEAANTSITTINESINTLNSGVIPNGVTTGQLLAKASNTDKDTAWVDPPTGGGGVSGDFLPIIGGVMTGDIDMSGSYISGVNGISTNDETPDAVAINLQQRLFHCFNGVPFGYHSDYSANYTARSIVDKAYVDSKTKTVFADIVAGVIEVDCPFADSQGISSNIAHLDIYLMNLAGNQILSLSHLSKFASFTRSVGLNPIYTITLENDQPQTGTCQIVFTAAPFLIIDDSGGNQPPQGAG